jgi:hypothetical protein
MRRALAKKRNLKLAPNDLQLTEVAALRTSEIKTNAYAAIFVRCCYKL